MIEVTKVFASFSVDDLTRARSFYGEVLGLDVSPDGAPMWLSSGASEPVMVYEKPDHAPASYTVLNLAVLDIDKAVDDLVRRGVEIVRYPGFETDDRGIFHAAGHAIAWFNDPVGNGLSVVQIG